MRHVAVALALLGCEPPQPGDVNVDAGCVYDQKNRTEAHRCLVECAKAGNPMSDEEGEDLVAQCSSSCSRIYCSAAYSFLASNGWRDCRAGIPQPYFDACVQAGWRP